MISTVASKAAYYRAGRCLSRGSFRAAAATCSRNYSAHAPLGVSNKFLKVSEEVRDAIATGKPVVALETTIYTHGFPYPNNLALASRLESIVRSTGGVPATIGVLDGVARVGMSENELSELATSAHQKKAIKVSRRDLGYICGAGLRGNPISGGTTIAGTMILAHLAGIKVFATGGLGGVHRGGESSMDISADLTELGRTPVAVVSSGCKSFLDIPRTLEYLETEGVVVATFADGRKGNIDFPAFFTRDSGIKTPKAIQNEADAAAIIYAQSSLNLSSGLLFTNPVPLEYSFPKPEMDAIIAKAVELSHIEGVHGSDNTPFILSKIVELSGGRSVAANTALIECNVKTGTKVAIELAKLEAEHKGGAVDRHMPAFTTSINQTQVQEELPRQVAASTTPVSASKPCVTSPTTTEKSDVLVVGSLAIDLACDFAPFSRQTTVTSPALHTSNPSAISQNLGGVGYNVALATSYMKSRVLFCSVVGDDISGLSALASLQKLDNPFFSSQGVQKVPPSSGARTAQYVAINDTKKDLMLAMADMSILELPAASLNFEQFWEPLILRNLNPNWAVIDANWGNEALFKWMALCKKHHMKVALEPVSAAKSARLFPRFLSGGQGATTTMNPSAVAPHRHLIDLATPNQYELSAMHTAAHENGYFDSTEWWGIIDALEMPSVGSRERLISLTNRKMVDQGIPQQSIQLLPFIPRIATKLGAEGVLLTQLLQPGDPRLRSLDYAPYILGRATADDASIGGVYMRLFPAAEKIAEADIVSVNGAGDTLLGVIVSALARAGRSKETRIEDVIPIAQRASIQTLKSAKGVNPDISEFTKLLDSI